MCAGPGGRAAPTREARPSRVLKFKRGELPPCGAARAERSRQGRVGGGPHSQSRQVRGSRGGVEPAANVSGGGLKSCGPRLRPYDGYRAVVRGAAPPGPWGNTAPGRLGTWGAALRRHLLVGVPWRAWEPPGGRTGGCPGAAAGGLYGYSFPGAPGPRPRPRPSSPTLGHHVQPHHRTAPLPAQEGR